LSFTSFTLLYAACITPSDEPRVIVSVAPALFDCEYVVRFGERDSRLITLDDADALMPNADRLLSLLTAEASAEAIELKVSKIERCNLRTLCPPLSSALCTMVVITFFLERRFCNERTTLSAPGSVRHGRG
jgi:hypothetical protein